jgi:hypothetical protein
MKKKISFDLPEGHFEVYEVARLALGVPSLSAFIRDALNRSAIAALNCSTIAEAQAKAKKARAALTK